MNALLKTGLMYKSHHLGSLFLVDLLYSQSVRLDSFCAWSYLLMLGLMYNAYMNMGHGVESRCT